MSVAAERDPAAVADSGSDPASDVDSDGAAAAPLGLAALARLAMPGTDLMPLGQRLLQRAQRDPDNADALMDLSVLLLLRGNRDESLAVQREALAVSRLHRRTTEGPPALRLLALMSCGDLMANTPLELMLESSDIELTMLYLLPDEAAPSALPPCDLVFIAIGESRHNQPLLARLHDATADGRLAGVPVVNAAARIAALSRDRASELLHDAPGVCMPPTRGVDRALLARLAAGLLQPAEAVGHWPLVIRPIDSHAGRGLQRIESPQAMREYLRSCPLTEQFYLSPFVDYRSADGLYRKYRIVLIDGVPLLCHLAVSSHWMIHYLNAGMAEHAARRDEEARAMASFDDDFAQRHGATLRSIAARLALDYVGLDCAELADGRLLVFEADTAMVVHAMDPPDRFGYKQPAMQRVFASFRQLLLARAGTH